MSILHSAITSTVHDTEVDFLTGGDSSDDSLCSWILEDSGNSKITGQPSLQTNSMKRLDLAGFSESWDSTKKFSIAMWVKMHWSKKGSSGNEANSYLIYSHNNSVGNGSTGIWIDSTDSIGWRINGYVLNGGVGSSQGYGGIASNEKLSDLAGWFHVCLSVDTTLSTAADRVKLYLNGVKLTTSQAVNAGSGHTVAQNTDCSFCASSDIRIGWGGKMSATDLWIVDSEQIDPVGTVISVDEETAEIKPISWSGNTNGRTANYKAVNKAKRAFLYPSTTNDSNAFELTQNSTGNKVYSDVGEYKFADAGSSLSFEGTSSDSSARGLEITSNNHWSSSDYPWDSSTDATFEFWYRAENLADYQGIYGNRYSSSYFCPLLVQNSGNGTLYAYFSASNVTWNVQLTSSSGALSEDTWHHIAITVKRGTTDQFAMYVDGSRVAYTATNCDFSGAHRPTHSQHFGMISASGDYPMDGWMDQIRFSSTNRYDVGSAGFTPPTAPFTNDSDTELLIQASYGKYRPGYDWSGNGNSTLYTNSEMYQTGYRVSYDSPVNTVAGLNLYSVGKWDNTSTNVGKPQDGIYVPTISIGKQSIYWDSNRGGQCAVFGDMPVHEGKWKWECRFDGHTGFSYNYHPCAGIAHAEYCVNGGVPTANWSSNSRGAAWWINARYTYAMAQANVFGSSSTTNVTHGKGATWFGSGNCVWHFEMDLDATVPWFHFKVNNESTWSNKIYLTSDGSSTGTVNVDEKHPVIPFFSTNSVYVPNYCHVNFGQGWECLAAGNNANVNASTPSPFEHPDRFDSWRDTAQDMFTFAASSSDFKPWTRQNLEEPAIKKPADHFDTVRYKGAYDGNMSIGSSKQVTTSCEPGIVMVGVEQDNTSSGYVYPALMQKAKGFAYSMGYNSYSYGDDMISATSSTSFTANDFSINSAADTTYDGNIDTYDNYWAAVWKATTSVTSWSGSGYDPSTEYKNATAGISVIAYSDQGSGNTETVNHGLGVKPDVMMVADSSGYDDFYVWHRGLRGSSADKWIRFNDTGSESSGYTYKFYDNTSTTFKLGSDYTGSLYGEEVGVILFATVPGFSRFGSTTNVASPSGTGTFDNTFVPLDFQPAFLMIKGIDRSGDWLQFSKAMGNQKHHKWNDGSSTTKSDSYGVHFHSNGFYVTGGSNIWANGEEVLWMAFAEHPMKYANGAVTSSLGLTQQ